MVEIVLASAGDVDSTPGLKFPGERNSNQLRCSCLGNPTDRGAGRLRPWRGRELDLTERAHTHFICPFFDTRVVSASLLL